MSKYRSAGDPVGGAAPVCCPVCSSVAEEVPMLMSSFHRCPACKEDVAYLRKLHKGDTPSPPKLAFPPDVHYDVGTLKIHPSSFPSGIHTTPQPKLTAQPSFQVGDTVEVTASHIDPPKGYITTVVEAYDSGVLILYDRGWTHRSGVLVWDVAPTDLRHFQLPAQPKAKGQPVNNLVGKRYLHKDTNQIGTVRSHDPRAGRIQFYWDGDDVVPSVLFTRELDLARLEELPF